MRVLDASSAKSVGRGGARATAASGETRWYNSCRLIPKGAVKMHTVISKQRVGGLTLVELIIVIAILAVLVGMLLPGLGQRPRPAYRIKCLNNLKQVGLAFHIFAADNQDRFPMQISTNSGGTMEFVNDGPAFRHFAALSNELSTPIILVCPVDKKRKAATNFVAMREANLSYFVGLDTRISQPKAFLSGDRNLTTNGRPVKAGLVTLTTNNVVSWTTEIHNLQGNAAMGDGSVQQFSGLRLAEALRETAVAANRLAVP